MYTFLTTIITIGALYIFGTASIREFAFPIIMGLLAGAYSSLFLAGPMWLWLDKRGKAKDGSKSGSKKSVAARA
jgi:preprotein translocase subunit SecF